MRRALVRTLDRVYSPSSRSSAPHGPRPTLATLDVLVAHSGGDMRSALMSLQFLLTEGGTATSFGGGPGGAGGAAKGRGKKRKRRGEESSDDGDDTAASGRGKGKGKGGKEGVKKL